RVLAARVLDEDEHHVAGDSKDDGKDGQQEGLVGLHGDRVEGIADERGGGAQPEQHVDEPDGVRRQDQPMAPSGLRPEVGHLSATLREAEEQCHEEHGQHDPCALRRRDGVDAGLHPEHEARGDRHHVEDGDRLQPHAVEEVQDEEGAELHARAGQEHERERDAAGGEREGPDERGPDVDVAGGEGAVPFDGMRAVGVHVADVIDDVDGARCETEREEDDDRVPPCAGVGELPREDQRRQANRVLRPLSRSDQPDERLHHRLPLQIARLSPGALHELPLGAFEALDIARDCQGGSLAGDCLKALRTLSRDGTRGLFLTAPCPDSYLKVPRVAGRWLPSRAPFHENRPRASLPAARPRRGGRPSPATVAGAGGPDPPPRRGRRHPLRRRRGGEHAEVPAHAVPAGHRRLPVVCDGTLCATLLAPRFGATAGVSLAVESQPRRTAPGLRQADPQLCVAGVLRPPRGARGSGARPSGASRRARGAPAHGSRMTEHGLPERTQVLVIGSGAGGATTARVLAEEGIEVTLVEEGPDIDTASIDSNSIDAIERLYRNGGMAPILGNQNIAYVEGRCVGGSTEINSGFWHRLPPDCYHRRRSEALLDDFSPERMDGYFQRAERDLSVSPLGREREPVSSAVFRRGIERLGWEYLEVPRCQRDPAASAFTAGAKQSMRQTYIPRGLEAGVRLLSGVKVKTVLHAGGRAAGVEAVAGADGHRQTIAADAVFVCCGAAQTPALLRRSGIRKNVGDNLCIHPMIKAAALFDEDIGAHDGPLPMYQVKQFSPTITIGGSVFTPGFLAMILSDNWEANRNAMLRWDHMALFYAGTRGMNRGSIRALPGADGNVVIRYRLTEADRRNLSVGLARLGELLFAAGAKAVYPSVREMPVLRSAEQCRALLRDHVPLRLMSLSTVHAFSSCPMGENPDLC